MALINRGAWRQSRLLTKWCQSPKAPPSGFLPMITRKKRYLRVLECVTGVSLKLTNLIGILRIWVPRVRFGF